VSHLPPRATRGSVSPKSARLSYIPHELRLQSLSAKFSTHVQSASLLGDFLVPGTQIEDGPVKFAQRSPHHPPAILGILYLVTVRTGTPVSDVGHGFGFFSLHPGIPCERVGGAFPRWARLAFSGATINPRGSGELLMTSAQKIRSRVVFEGASTGPAAS
jgi:hypothetical protein